MPGTKRKRGADSWLLEVTVGSDFTGKPVRYSKTVHCRSESAADKELALFYADCVNGKVNRSAPVTVSELASSKGQCPPWNRPCYKDVDKTAAWKQKSD